MSQRYGVLASRLGIVTPILRLRRYSATELIAAGVDVRTVAGRLGHGGGGTTTPRVYAAFVSESDQRAASSPFARMPDRPTGALLTSRANRASHPYQLRAAALCEANESGVRAVGEFLPGAKALAAKH